MQASPWLSVILLFCCVRLFVSGNVCPAGTWNSIGMRCDTSANWKFVTGFTHCVGLLSANKMNYVDARQHCWTPGGFLILTRSVAENRAVQTWRVANSANVETWMTGMRKQSSSKSCTRPPFPNWTPWYWDNFADGYGSGEEPWAGGEPKSNCYPAQEKCYAMNEGGRWTDRECRDNLYALCQKVHETCHPCNEDKCAVGQYRTSCPAGAMEDSKCAACGAGLACTARNTTK